MTSKIPLKSLYAFVAVAETGSMTEAANQLNVSHSAISQSIKNLEKQLGQTIFSRIGRCVKLNNAGEKYYQKVAPALEQIVDATTEIQKPINSNRLMLNMANSLAIHWWIPRVLCFQKMAPNLDVRISTLAGSFNMDLEGIDVALIHGSTDGWANYYCDKLSEDELVLVCHPEILKPETSLQSLLENFPAIYTTNERRKHDWQVWCAGNNIKTPRKRNSLTFAASIQSIQAAQRKLGVFVTHRQFVKDDIEQGLLAEFATPVFNPHQSFFFACQPEKLKLDSVQTLRAWLHKEFDIKGE